MIMNRPDRDTIWMSFDDVIASSSEGTVAIPQQDTYGLIVAIGSHQIKLSIPVKVRCRQAKGMLTDAEGSPSMKGAVAIAEKNRNRIIAQIRHGQVKFSITI